MAEADGRGRPADGSPTDVRLDLRGLHCPMPVLRARKALRRMRPGEGVVLECTDPLTAIDIPHFASQEGHRLVGQCRDGALYLYRILRGEAAASID